VVLPVQIHVRRVTELCCCIHNVFCQLRMVVELADRKVTALAMIFLFVEILGSMSDVQGVHRLYNLQCKLFVTCWIWGFHGGEYEECRLLECYSMWLL
jgi:uncharacterized membrane protein YGL010W